MAHGTRVWAVAVVCGGLVGCTGTPKKEGPPPVARGATVVNPPGGPAQAAGRTGQPAGYPAAGGVQPTAGMNQPGYYPPTSPGHNPMAPATRTDTVPMGVPARPTMTSNVPLQPAGGSMAPSVAPSGFQQPANPAAGSMPPPSWGSQAVPPAGTTANYPAAQAHSPPVGTPGLPTGTMVQRPTHDPAPMQLTGFGGPVPPAPPSGPGPSVGPAMPVAPPQPVAPAPPSGVPSFKLQ